jgi:hypothetical protein
MSVRSRVGLVCCAVLVLGACDSGADHPMHWLYRDDSPTDVGLILDPNFGSTSCKRHGLLVRVAVGRRSIDGEDIGGVFGDDDMADAISATFRWECGRCLISLDEMVTSGELVAEGSEFRNRFAAIRTSPPADVVIGVRLSDGSGESRLRFASSPDNLRGETARGWYGPRSVRWELDRAFTGDWATGDCGS